MAINQPSTLLYYALPLSLSLFTFPLHCMALTLTPPICWGRLNCPPLSLILISFSYPCLEYDTYLFLFSYHAYDLDLYVLLHVFCYFKPDPQGGKETGSID